MRTLLSSFLLLSIVTFSFGESVKERKKVAQHLQNISVTIKSKNGYSSSEGSGVLVVREIGDDEVTFVWTAGHVVDNLREVREVITESGQPRKVIEFKDAQIVREMVESGRRVGEIKMDARVIKYSNADTGHDLALLMVRAKNYGKDSSNFYLNDEDPIIPIGTNLYHVGSLLGQMGANSMTTGIVSQIGRTIDKMEFDQTTVTAFPGSSGGGVFLTDGKYVGMLVRGAGEGFNLIVPIRRMLDWAEKNDILWAIDPGVESPSLDDIDEIPVEDSGINKKKKNDDEDEEDDPDESAFEQFPFLIRITPETKK
jgi:S1-C subfamily serine protease